jgi:predicted O-methyltransferase YrrM
LKNVRPGAFSKADRWSPEVEVSAFVGDIERLVKPYLVVEVGTYEGRTARAIEEALGENAALGVPGRLFTFEVDEVRARGCSEQLGASVTVVALPVWDWLPDERVDVAFIDGPYESRAQALDHLARFMAPRGLVFLHDSAFTEEKMMGPLMQRVRGRYNVIEFPTARGLALVQPLGGIWDGSRGM